LLCWFKFLSELGECVLNVTDLVIYLKVCVLEITDAIQDILV